MNGTSSWKFRGVAFGLLLAVIVWLAPQAALAQKLYVRTYMNEDYVLYEPSLAANFNRKSMPLVVYLHGAPWFIEHDRYDGMLYEIAAAGCVVVMPMYGEKDIADPDFWRFDLWYADALTKTRRALRDIQYGGVSKWSPFQSNLALVGHSLGGVFALKMAKDTAAVALPTFRRLPALPRTLVLHDAAGYSSLPFVFPDDPEWIEDLRGIDDRTSLTLIASMDEVVRSFLQGDTNATAIWARAWHRSGVLSSKRAYIAYGGHFDVYGIGDYDLYVEATVAALRPVYVQGVLFDPAPDQRFDGPMNEWFRP